MVMNFSTTDEPSLRRSELCVTTEYVAPENGIGEILAGIWRDVLDIDEVGLNDDFFEIGGDSLGATIIASNIESRFGFRFSPSQMVEANTVGKQLSFIENKQKETQGPVREHSLPNHMSLLNAQGTKPFLFMVHGGRGMTLHDRRFLEGLDPDQPLVLIDAIGFDGKEKMPDTVEKTAARYLDGVLKIAPDGPLLLAAPCSGSLVILEMARQLQKAGRPAERVMMIDPGTHWFEDPYLSGIKGYRKMLGRILFIAQLRYFLRRLKHKLGVGNVAKFEKSLKQKAKDLKAMQERMNKNTHAVAEEPSTNEADIHADAILDTQEIYHRATSQHRPQRWDGEVYLLITKPREAGIPVIKNVLTNTRLRTTDFSHDTLFKEGISDVLRFLDDALHHKDEPGMFS
jgi:thioesterase domain-containing protein/acyl carrier protein